MPTWISPVYLPLGFRCFPLKTSAYGLICLISINHFQDKSSVWIQLPLYLPLIHPNPAYQTLSLVFLLLNSGEALPHLVWDVAS